MVSIGARVQLAIQGKINDIYSKMYRVEAELGRTYTKTELSKLSSRELEHLYKIVNPPEHYSSDLKGPTKTGFDDRRAESLESYGQPKEKTQTVNLSQAKPKEPEKFEPAKKTLIDATTETKQAPQMKFNPITGKYELADKQTFPKYIPRPQETQKSYWQRRKEGIQKGQDKVYTPLINWGDTTADKLQQQRYKERRSGKVIKPMGLFLAGVGAGAVSGVTTALKDFPKSLIPPVKREEYMRIGQQLKERPAFTSGALAGPVVATWGISKGIGKIAQVVNKPRLKSVYVPEKPIQFKGYDGGKVKTFESKFTGVIRTSKGNIEFIGKRGGAEFPYLDHKAQASLSDVTITKKIDMTTGKITDLKKPFKYKIESGSEIFGKTGIGISKIIKPKGKPEYTLSAFRGATGKIEFRSIGITNEFKPQKPIVEGVTTFSKPRVEVLKGRGLPEFYYDKRTGKMKPTPDYISEMESLSVSKTKNPFVDFWGEAKAKAKAYGKRGSILFSENIQKPVSDFFSKAEKSIEGVTPDPYWYIGKDFLKSTRGRGINRPFVWGGYSFDNKEKTVLDIASNTKIIPSVTETGTLFKTRIAEKPTIDLGPVIDLGVRTWTGTDTITETTTDTSSKPKPPIEPPFLAPPTGTPTAPPPDVPPLIFPNFFSFGSESKGKKRAVKKAKSKYAPSITAIIAKIKGKSSSKILTGFGIRPIQKGGKINV